MLFSWTWIPTLSIFIHFWGGAHAHMCTCTHGNASSQQNHKKNQGKTEMAISNKKRKERTHCSNAYMRTCAHAQRNHSLKSHHMCVIRDSKYVTKGVKCYNSGSEVEGNLLHNVTCNSVTQMLQLECYR